MDNWAKTGPEPRSKLVQGLSLCSAWLGGGALNGSGRTLKQGRTPWLDCLLINRGVLGTKASRAGCHRKKARSWGSKSLGIGQSGLENWQAIPTGTLPLIPQPVLVPVSRVARYKLRLQQGMPLPGGGLELVCPLPPPPATQKPRWRASYGGENLSSTVETHSWSWYLDSKGQGQHQRVSEGLLLPQYCPCMLSPCPSSLTLLSKANPGIQESWSRGP